MNYKNYGYFSKIFSLFGIDFNESRNSKVIKCSRLLKSPLFILFVFSVLYMAPNLTLLAYNGTFEIKSLIPLTLAIVQSFLVWIIIFKKKFHICAVLTKIDRFSNKQLKKSIQSHRSFLVNAMIVSVTLFQMPYTPLLVYLMNSESAEVFNHWTFGYYVENNILRSVTMFFSLTAFVVSLVTFPVYATLLISSMYLNCSDTLRSYHKQLCIVSMEESRIPFIKEYSNLIKIVHQLCNVLSTPAFIVVTLNFTVMLSCVASVLFIINKPTHLAFVLEVEFLLTCAFFSILLLSLTAAEIHVQTEKLAAKFRELYERELHHCRLSTRSLRLLKAIADKNVPPVSACGIIYFKRSYPISAFGGFITYALLILNLNL